MAVVERPAQTFPQLTAAQISRVASVGKRHEVRAGETLFEVGDKNTRFFVVLDGSVEVLRPLGDGEEQVAVHGPGAFTGEIDMLSGRRSLVRARAASRSGDEERNHSGSNSEISERPAVRPPTVRSHGRPRSSSHEHAGAAAVRLDERLDLAPQLRLCREGPGFRRERSGRRDERPERRTQRPVAHSSSRSTILTLARSSEATIGLNM